MFLYFCASASDSWESLDIDCFFTVSCVICSDLDENLQKGFYKYLEVRGIKPSATNYLREYMANKDNREYLLWLKYLKKFVEEWRVYSSFLYYCLWSETRIMSWNNTICRLFYIMAQRFCFDWEHCLHFE